MPRALGTALSRINRLANRLQLGAKPDVTKMSDEDLCVEAVELSLEVIARRVDDFNSYEEFVDAVSKIAVLRTFQPMVIELQQRWQRRDRP